VSENQEHAPGRPASPAKDRLKLLRAQRAYYAAEERVKRSPIGLLACVGTLTVL